ncbi:hypothetical protein DYD21_08845 [Rhodohalobacter sp. SW132]|uniref:YqaJ viral recombinase family nuclease n=1 Tax=Rhodohalobacter sp. SW132 TaxID=2293433 RepID=UPI000E26B359|nr:YqaJ viral recombinase family protein [Rhodohalobacter sp. SW132]REL37876.1 hypothetical protein DYD21_08845 [Rhodohalobacter sp. SW132]
MNSISTKDLSLGEWRKLRGNFIGGSDSASVLGKSKYKSPYMVWLEKTQNVSFFKGNAFSNFGTLFEPIVRDHFRKSMNLEVTEPAEMFIHPEYPMLSGNVDGLIHGEGNLGLGVLEIKCSTTNRISPHELAQNIPIEWYTQLMHYMGILDVGYGFLQVYYRDICEFADPVFVERDDELIKANNRRLSQWWKTFVEGNTPPLPSTTEDLLIKHPDSHESHIEASVHIRQRYNMLLSLKERIAGLNEMKTSIEFDLKQYCGDHQVITADGKPILTWKSSTRRSFNSKQFRKDYPELYARYQTETQTRTLRLKQDKL